MALWHIQKTKGPLIAISLHSGHCVRLELEEIMAVSATERLREEDPFTDQWIEVAPTRVKLFHSRFEVDLNRPRDQAVYLNPEDAWGLKVFRHPPPESLKSKILSDYDLFYQEMEKIITKKIKANRYIVIFDIHSYNHRRKGPDREPEDPQGNPEVNLGTGTLNRKIFGPLADRFMKDLRAYSFMGRHLDVRENIRFKGGNFSRWAHEKFPGNVCVLAIEFKKFFMDEWTGKPDTKVVEEIKKALHSTVPGVLAELKKLKSL
jgi:N-formylglutamate amidohydrolase